MPINEKFPAQVIADALIAAKGLKSVAALSVPCAWNTVDRYVRTYKICRDALDIARDQTTDIAEGKLYLAIGKGEPWAIALYLRTQGRNRGYFERQELTGAEGGPINIREVIVSLPPEDLSE